MAIFTVSYSPDKCKTFPDGKTYLKGFGWEDDNLDRWEMSGFLRNALRKPILTGTNDRAFSILTSAAPIDHIPGAGGNFVPLNGFAKFYGVSEDFLKGVLNRRGYIQKAYPDDVKRVITEEIAHNDEIPLFRDWAIKAPGRPELDCYRLMDKHGPPCVFLPRRYTFLVYSPRIVLATALSLLDTDKSGESNTARKVALALKRSDYRIIEDESEKEAGSVKEEKPAGVPVTAGGELVISPEFLSSIIKTAVKEAVSEVMAEVRSSVPASHAPVSAQAPRRHSSAKLKKPDGWDEIVTNWGCGILSTEEAAERAGMCASSFRNYASGRKVFN